MTIEEQLNELREQFNHKLEKIVSAIDRQQEALSVVSKYLGKQLFPRDNPVVERQESNVEPKQTSRYIKVGADTIKHVENLWPGDALTAYGGPIPEIKRDWEVLEFRSNIDKGAWTQKDGEWISSGLGLFADWNNLMYGIESVEDGKIRIHSVRRVSDGTIWSIGDVVANPPRGSGRISKFSINKNGVMLVEADCFTTPWSLLNIVADRSIYTSADGVEIHQSDQVFRWVKGGTRIIEDRACAGDDPDVHYSTRIAAETAYKNWLGEQRLLSLHDVLECLGDVEKLEAVVKGRLS